MTVHGGNIYRTEAELGLKPGSFLDFSASINPLGMPEQVVACLKKNIASFTHYPDPDSLLLSEKIAAHYGLAKESVLCGNGSTELIYLISRALQPKQILLLSPTFSEYERACRMNSNPEIIRYRLRQQDGFTINPDKFIRLMTGCDAAFLCNPNNPTGRVMQPEDILHIANAARKIGCLLIVDEAFIDFCPENSVLDAVKDNQLLIVLRSMTKFYALAGLRIGWGVFPSRIVRLLRRYREPWTVNSAASEAAQLALRDNAYREATFRLMQKEKRFLEEGFRELKVKYFPPDANFYLLHSSMSVRLLQGLFAKGILIRNCANFRGLGSGFIRIAVRSRKENIILLRELEKVLKQDLKLAAFSSA